MPNYLYDGLALPYPKTDKRPLTGGDDPTKHVAMSDWNSVAGAVDDLRNGLLLARFVGLHSQASTPVSPATGDVRLYVRTNGLASPNLRDQLCVVWGDGSIVVLSESPPR